MGDFRSFKTARRLPAAPMKPVVDPAGWKPRDLKDVVGLELSAHRSRRRRACRRRSRPCASNGVAMVDIRKDDFPLKGFGEVLARRAPRTDGRPRHRDDAGFPARPFRPRGGRHRLYRARRLARQHHVAEQVRPHPRPCEGPRRRLQRCQHPRLHDQCRDALPHRRLRLCRAALPADVEVGRRKPDRELGDGLQQDPRDPARPRRNADASAFYRSRSGEVSEGSCRISRSRSSPSQEGYFSATGLARRSKRRRSSRACRNSRRRRRRRPSSTARPSTRSRSTSTSSAATSSSSTIS